MRAVMVWHGVVWRDVARCSVAWSGTARSVKGMSPWQMAQAVAVVVEMEWHGVPCHDFPSGMVSGVCRLPGLGCACAPASNMCEPKAGGARRGPRPHHAPRRRRPHKTATLRPRMRTGTPRATAIARHSTTRRPPAAPAAASRAGAVVTGPPTSLRPGPLDWMARLCDSLAILR